MTDWESDALSGLGRPRPLPPGLRRRLEHAIASGAGDKELPLGDELASRLEDALSDRVAAALAGADAPRPLPAPTRARMEQALLAGRRTPRWIGAAAAALLVAGGVTAGLLSTGTGSGAPGAASQAARAPRTEVPAGSGSNSGGAAQSQGGAVGAATPNAAVASPVQGVGATAGSVPVPVVASVQPDTGPQGGGTWVVVTGSGFEGVTEVSFGSVRAQAFTVVSATELRAESPRHDPGAVDVRVSAAGGTSALVLEDRFTYAGS